jgi:hypothetical protein
MGSNPKAPAWRSLTTASSASDHAAQTRRTTKLSLDAWPELPNKYSLKQTSSETVSRKTHPPEGRSPNRSMDKVSSRSAENSPRGPSSEVIHPRHNCAIPARNELKASLSLESSTMPSKHAASKSSLSAPSDFKLQKGSRMPPIRTHGFVQFQFHNVTALQAALKEDPQSNLAYIQSLIKENGELKTKVAFMSDRLDYERKHLEKTIQGYEELQCIGKAKQYILWQFIQRLTAGDNDSRTSRSEPVTCIEAIDEENSKLQREQSGENMKLDPNAVCFLSIA